MDSAPWPERWLTAALVFISAAILRGEPADRGPLITEFFYVAANTGSSSGGHCGLRFDDRVYHFGVRDGRLLIERDPWRHFEREHRLLNNRRVEITRLPFNEGDSRRIKSRLDRIYLVQEKLLDRERVLELEQAWLRAFAPDGDRRLSLAWAGYFTSGHPDSGGPDSGGPASPQAIELRDRIARHLGPKFLTTALRQVERELREEALNVSHVEDPPLPLDRFPFPASLGADRLRERLHLRLALETLRAASGLEPGSCVIPDTPGLTEAERQQLKRLEIELEGRIVLLLQSNRPDRGGDLLLATARRLAVTKSLEENRWVLLDPISWGQPSMTAEDATRHASLLSEIAAQGQYTWEQTREEHAANLDLIAYSSLETTAARYMEPRMALAEKRAVREPQGLGVLLPCRSGPVDLPHWNLPENEVRQALEIASRNLQAYQEALAIRFHYALLRHNCATRLVEILREAVPSERHAGFLDQMPEAGDRLTFIPRLLSTEIRRHLPESARTTLPSWREFQIDLATRDSADWPIHLRESNRWTAEHYPGSIRDSSFLFFADGPPITRPVVGIGNLGYSLITTGGGLIRSPFDAGRQLHRGLQGALYSFPELICIPIRKGKYDIVPLDAGSDPLLLPP